MARRKRRKTSRPPPSSTHGSGLVPLSCPDCFGVLSYEREGPHDHLLYRCQVDHRYTISSLLQTKEGQLERILWSATLALKQLAYAYEDLVSELKKVKGADRRRVERRVKEVRQQYLAVRAMIEATHAVE